MKTWGVFRTVVSSALLSCAFMSAARSASAQESVRVAASKRYVAARVHQFALGGGYRALWEAEIDLPILDLSQAGGLTPSGRYGGLQTAVLGFRSADGRAFSFRGTDKDPSAILPSVLKDTFVRELVQDQMAAQHPAGALAASVISRAAGVLTIDEQLVVMPDDPVLGEWRAEFAGMVGSFYEYPTASPGASRSFGATQIIEQDELYDRLRKSNADGVDVDAFLRARLVDILLGDFDRHRKQWRWASIPGSDLWQPIPEDRDQAFVRYDGVVQRFGSLYAHILQCYGPEFPSMDGLTFHGWEQDRWLLSGVEWERWKRIAADIQQRVSNAVIDDAINALPPEYARLDGERMRHDVRGRRDRLLAGARSYYEHLVAEIDIQTSHASDRVFVNGLAGGMVRIEVNSFARVFLPEETQEVRIYLRGGDDVVHLQGGPTPIRIHVIPGRGNKVLRGSWGGEFTVYDEKGVLNDQSDSQVKIATRAYKLPPSNSGFVDIEDVPPRDWGSDVIPIPKFGYERDVGIYLGLGAVYTSYGFRKHPWARKYKFSAAFATEAREPLVGLTGLFRLQNPEWVAQLDAEFSGIDVLRFYGFGNETKSGKDDSFFRVRNEQLRLSQRFNRSDALGIFRVSAGPWFQYSRTHRGSRLIDSLAPYGSGEFGALGLALRATLDTRGSIEEETSGLSLSLGGGNPAAGYPTRGFLVDIESRLSPPLLDVSKTWGIVEGSAAAFYGVGAKGRVAFAARAGGAYTFGRVPYFAAAFVGGGRVASGDATIRGFRAQRFAGDASVYGNFDVRVFLLRVKLGLPGDLGLHGFADVGRVFLKGEKSDVWHPSAGGGIWFSPLFRTNAISLSVAGSGESLLFYLRAGFHY